ncbi:PfkB family carbohydrate kinase [Ovoidimarina sediminis]|uniref:PfkB family carbohydrate kinase n=1 Tax=Ovoidimarina sediminis TaxID=3079856 RepID=UPI002910F72A|nr:PfkB family carbohydrate kinase [Rhodophyticola sp. MJ-SS7]MDU8942093.1 PfkB family carbohydrate kinase [Rhodophyticola sp. MJ-SS7]
MTSVLCAGIAVLDFVFEVEEFPRTAEKYVAHDTSIVGGGCAANAAVAVARLGGKAILAADLGDDPVGRLVLEDLAAEGVDISGISPVPGARSSYSSVLVDHAGERQIVNYRGTPMAPQTDWFDNLGAVAAVLVDTRRSELARAGLAFARSRGVPGIIDGEAPIPDGLLDNATHAAFSRRGLASLYPQSALEDALREVSIRYGIWACVTDGEKGVWYTTDDRTAHMPAFNVIVKDTLGAGDIWHGAFSLALGEGQTEAEAVRFASAAAALKCTVPGGRAGSPTRPALQGFLENRRL